MDQQTTPSNKKQLRVERQFMKLVGANIRTFDETNNLICFAQAKAFKLREEIVFYSDEAKTSPLFTTKARNIIDIAPTFDMIDKNGAIFGSLKRKGLMSMYARDEWLILDANGAQIGEVVEDGYMMGILRRQVDFLSLFIPQTYSVTFNGTEVAEVKQKKNPFLVRYDYSVDMTNWNNYSLLFMAIINLLAVIEGRQS